MRSEASTNSSAASQAARTGVVVRLGHAGDGHVGVADGLDLFQPVLRADAVELGEVGVEPLDDLGCGEMLGELAEALEVGEDDRGVLEVDRLDVALVAQLAGDLVRQDAVEQPDVFGQRLLEHALEVLVHRGLVGLALLEEEEVERVRPGQAAFPDGLAQQLAHGAFRVEEEGDGEALLLVVEAVEGADHGVDVAALALGRAVAQVEDAREEDLVVADEGGVLVAELAVDLAPALEEVVEWELLVVGNAELRPHALDQSLGDLAHREVLEVLEQDLVRLAELGLEVEEEVPGDQPGDAEALLGGDLGCGLTEHGTKVGAGGGVAKWDRLFALGSL